MNNPKTLRTFEKVRQRMKAILRRNTKQRQNVFVQHFVTLKQFERRTREMFSTLEEKFRVSARPRNILYLFLE